MKQYASIIHDLRPYRALTGLPECLLQASDPVYYFVLVQFRLYGTVRPCHLPLFASPRQIILRHQLLGAHTYRVGVHCKAAIKLAACFQKPQACSCVWRACVHLTMRVEYTPRTQSEVLIPLLCSACPVLLKELRVLSLQLTPHQNSQSAGNAEPLQHLRSLHHIQVAKQARLDKIMHLLHVCKSYLGRFVRL